MRDPDYTPAIVLFLVSVGVVTLMVLIISVLML